MTKVLLAVHNKGNRRVLAEWLSAYHQLVVTEDLGSLPPDVDLCIVDAVTLQNQESAILAYKKQHFPKHTPVLLIVQRAKVGIASARIGKSVDELIVAPIEKDELKARIHGLLRTRSLTVNLLRLQAGTKGVLKSLQDRQFALDQHAIVAIADLQGRITYANDKFCNISGYSREELIGQNHAIINSGHHPKGFWEEMYRTVASGQPWHAEVCNRAKNGDIYWVDTTIAPLGDETGKLKEYIAIRTDMTERKRMEQEADSANRAKSEFLANMSHEIRTPMNGVVGMVDILQTTDLTSKQLRMVRTIRDSSLSLLAILNDILDFSKIEAGKMSIETIPTHLRDVMESVAQLMIPNVATKDLDLHLFVFPDLPVWMLSDPLRLRQILFNLLGNAVKFTDSTDDHRGQVWVRAYPAASRENGQARLCISIKDNGIGMSAETLARLFDPFAQADASTTRRFGGTGLGLNITRRLVALMHGQVFVHSHLGEGSEFLVELPLVEGSPQNAHAPAWDLTGVRLLAVTADPALKEILTAYLAHAGVEAHVAADWDAAREQGASTPDAQVLLLGPDVHGDPTQAAQMSPAMRVVRLIPRNVSSHQGSEITIPIAPLLYQELSHGIALAAGKITGQTRTQEGERTALAAPSVEQAQADGRLILLAEDNQTNREVIQEQLSILGYASEVANDGLAALTCWRNGNYALLLTDCHMPDMDGFELTRAIRMEESQERRIPIIAVTANAMQGEADRCLEVGMDDYLSKPLRLDELSSKLKKWMPRVKEQKKAPVVTNPLPEIAPDEDVPMVWDTSVLPRMIGDNPQAQRRILDGFLIRAHDLVTTLGECIATEDSARIADLAHQLKSPALSIGAMRLGTLCQQLELAGRANDLDAIQALAHRLAPDFEDVAGFIRAS